MEIQRIATHQPCAFKGTLGRTKKNTTYDLNLFLKTTNLKNIYVFFCHEELIKDLHIPYEKSKAIKKRNNCFFFFMKHIVQCSSSIQFCQPSIFEITWPVHRLGTQTWKMYDSLPYPAGCIRYSNRMLTFSKK